MLEQRASVCACVDAGGRLRRAIIARGGHAVSRAWTRTRKQAPRGCCSKCPRGGGGGGGGSQRTATCFCAARFVCWRQLRKICALFVSPSTRLVWLPVYREYSFSSKMEEVEGKSKLWSGVRWVFYVTVMTLSIVVFACIANRLFSAGGGCNGFNSRDGCNYAVATGVISFVFLLFWLIWTSLECFDAVPDSFGPLRVIGVELVTNFLVMLLWFVSGIVLSAQQDGISSCTSVTGVTCGCARAALGISWVNWVLELGFCTALLVTALKGS